MKQEMVQNFRNRSYVRSVRTLEDNAIRDQEVGWKSVDEIHLTRDRDQ